MRFMDFMVYYTMANFKRRKMDGLMWATPLFRAVFLASLNLNLLLLILAEFIFSFTFKLNLLDNTYTKVILVIVALAVIQLFDYIYINKRRYEYITSPAYKAFKMRESAGVAICFLIFVFSLLGSIAAGVLLAS